MVEAENGEAGMAAAAQHEGKIDLVITDVVMPGMGGRELVKQLAAVAPRNQGALSLRIHRRRDRQRRHHREAAPRSCKSPFTLQNLSRKVREVLG